MPPGAGFAKTRTFKRGDALQGRVDLSADAKGAWLLWTEERDRQTLWLQRLDTSPAGFLQRKFALQSRSESAAPAKRTEVPR